MAFPCSLALILSLIGQTASTEGLNDKRATRLEFMKASLKVHTVHPVSDPKYHLQTAIRASHAVQQSSRGRQ